MAHQIKSLATQQQYQHPVLNCPGWWGRTARILYGNKKLNTPGPVLDEGCKPILIIGNNGLLEKALVKLCEERGLKYKAIIKNHFDTNGFAVLASRIEQEQPWAIVDTEGTTGLAAYCGAHGIKMLNFLSDLSFEDLSQILKKAPHTLILSIGDLSAAPNNAPVIQQMLGIGMDLLIDDEQGIWELTPAGGRVNYSKSASFTEIDMFDFSER